MTAIGARGAHATRCDYILGLLVGLALSACSKAPGRGASIDAGTEPTRDAGVHTPDAEAEPAAARAPRLCSSDGWCWAGPGPHGNTLHAVTATSVDDVWAVGELGIAMHFDGSHWQPRWAPGREHLRAVHVDGAEVWAAGDEATLLHGVGGQWQTISVEGLTDEIDLRGIASDASGNLWVVGSSGTLIERRDDAWGIVSIGVASDLNAVWTDGAELWVAGDAGVVMRLRDQLWAPVEAGTDQDLVAIAGEGDEIWIAGAGGEVRRYDSDSARFERPDGDGTPPSGPISALAVTGRLAYVATERGDLHVWDGDETCPVPGDAGAPEEPCPKWAPARSSGQEAPLLGVWADGEDAVAVGAFGSIVRWQSAARTVVSAAALDTYLDVSGTSSGEVWVAGDRLLQLDADTWTIVDRDSARAIYAVQALGSGQALVAGTGGMSRRWSGEAWQDLDVSADSWLRGVWSDGESGWLVGARGRTWGLLNRRLWTALESPTERDLLAVWSSPLGNAWAVGAAGTVLRHDGADWATIPSGPDGGVTADLRAVHGTDDADIFAVGTAGTALHWDGTRWTPTADVASYSLNGVWTRAPREAWAVGSGGTILRYDGDVWHAEFSGTARALHAVWGDSERVWAVGEHGALLVKALQVDP